MITSLLNKLKENAFAFPERAAYVSGDESITFGALVQMAQRYGALLRKEGSSPVIIYGHKEISFFVSMVSCLFAGRAYVPIDRSVPHLRVKRIIELSGASLLLSGEEAHFGNIKTSTLEALLQYAGEEEKEIDNGIAYMIFTSGSTGEPKGVPISYGNLENFVRWVLCLPVMEDLSACTVLNQASFNFDLSVADMYYALCGGHTLMALGANHGFDLSEMFSVIRRCDAAVMTPTFIKLCLSDPSFTAAAFPRLRCIYFCGEELQQKTVLRLLEAFPALAVINAYGPTEATSAVSAVLITKEIAEMEPLLPAGVVDTAAVEICIENNEIVLKGKSVFAGYLGGVIGGHFTENGVECYRTGDFGYIENGLLYCRGRMDSQIKYRGYRIELGEIESALSEVPGVLECAAVAKRTPAGDIKAIAAYAVVEGDLTPVQIKQTLSARLPEYMVPKIVRLLPELPVNQNGKTDRKRLAEL